MILDHSLKYKSPSQIIQLLQALPRTLTSLNLSLNDLDSKSAAELVQIFLVLPQTLTSLDLSYNNLGSKSAAELVQIFLVLPQTLTSLDLSLNNLGSKSAAELVQIFQRLPQTLTSLDLSLNDLDSKSAAELVQIYQVLPRTLTSLNSSFNDLGFKSAAELVQIFLVLPQTLTSLDLSYNNLFSKSAAEFVQIFLVLPRTLTSLNLSYNILDSKSAAELVQIFQMLPRTLTSLNLCYNNLFSKSAAELVQIFQVLPRTLTSLNLCYNNLGSKLAAEFVQIFQALPSTLSSISLFYNIGYLSEDNLTAALMHTNITEVIGDRFPNSLITRSLRQNRNRIEEIMITMGQVAYHLRLGHDVLTEIISWLPMAVSSGTAKKLFRGSGEPIPQLDLNASQMALASFDSYKSLRENRCKSLQNKINELECYGSHIALTHPDKGNKVISLAKELNVLLLSFLDKPYLEQQRTFSQFKNDFVKKLHSEDTIVSTHRAYWKVICANILIALTGIGAILLGINYYATSGSLFFSKTQTQQKVDTIEREMNSVSYYVHHTM
jgi:hypothetical protein